MYRSIIFSVIALLFVACNSEKKNSFFQTRELQVDSLPGQSPYLTKDNNGNVVLSWVRKTNDSVFSFCYALSKDGRTFGDPIIIPNSNTAHPHGENLPKIIFKPSGEIIALWGASNPNPRNEYSGLVFYVQSFDEGKTWTSPRPLISDTASYDQRYYDVDLLPNGEVGIIWLDNRKTTKQEGSGLYFASTDGKNGFQHDRLISQPCCQCCRTDLFVDSKGNIHALYRGIIKDSIRDMVHIVSRDAGKTFSDPKLISNDNWVFNGCPHTGPSMAESKEGLQFSWFTGGKERGCFYSMSADNGASFTKRNSVSGSGSHPQIASFSDGKIIIVWDEVVTVNDKPYKRIGVQERTANGASLKREYITPDTLTSSYPVISTLDGNNALIAYTVQKAGSNFIRYQVINQ